jgi:glycolate oxidase iron-sulfur subunit
MLEEARTAIEQILPHSMPVRWLRQFVFRFLFMSPARLHAAFRLLRFYQLSGLQWITRHSGLMRLLSRKIFELEELLPPVPPAKQAVRVGQTLAPYGPQRFRVAFFVGCVMNELMSDIQKATLEVLRHNGCEVVIPMGQACCGALHSHSGEREMALELMERNVRVFSGLNVDSIVSNAAGCGTALKEYGELARHRPAIADKAIQMARRVEDISQFLARIDWKQPTHRLNKRVAYDDPCHLVHGQKISKEPRLLLQSIPGIEWCVLPNADHCCGSAGTYNVTHFSLSMQILEKKMKAISLLRPDIVATGNPGCLLQLSYGAKRFGVAVEVRHPVELLAAGYNK